MCRHGAPCLRISSAIRCGTISSRRFPRCTGPDGLIPDAQVGAWPGCLRSASARTWSAVRTTQSSAGATGQATSIVSAGISVQGSGRDKARATPGRGPGSPPKRGYRLYGAIRERAASVVEVGRQRGQVRDAEADTLVERLTRVPRVEQVVVART